MMFRFASNLASVVTGKKFRAPSTTAVYVEFDDLSSISCNSAGVVVNPESGGGAIGLNTHWKIQVRDDPAKPGQAEWLTASFLAADRAWDTYKTYRAKIDSGIWDSETQGCLAAKRANITNGLSAIRNQAIPILLSQKRNGKLPWVMDGDVGSIARKWEVDPDCDQLLFDSMKEEFCRSNPRNPECGCLSAAVQDPYYARMKAQIPSADHCWYLPCTHGLSSASGVFMTTRKQGEVCPTVVCPNIIVMEGIDESEISKIQQSTDCSVTNKTGGDGVVLPNMDASRLIAWMKSRTGIAVIAGSSVALALIITLIAVLVGGSRKKR